VFSERKAIFPIGLLIVGVLVIIWSYIDSHDHFIWWLEALPALIATVLLWVTYRRFRFTDLAYGLIFVHAVILLIGAHYTCAEVPPFNWLRGTYDLSRNHYDRIGHFAQGFVPAMAARVLLLRTSPLKRGRWLFALIVLSCLGISAAYELLEWAAAEVSGEAASAFLGTQGDSWDTQKDTALALIGATTALLVLRRWHDRLLARLD
jgi:putative membrane protein